MSAQQYVHSDSMKYLHSTFRQATLRLLDVSGWKAIAAIPWALQKWRGTKSLCLGWSPERNTRTNSLVTVMFKSEAEIRP